MIIHYDTKDFRLDEKVEDMYGVGYYRLINRMSLEYIVFNTNINMPTHVEDMKSQLPNVPLNQIFKQFWDETVISGYFQVKEI